jgi:outer membrane protein OmpA-like peptidoglycan-associated protein
MVGAETSEPAARSPRAEDAAAATKEVPSMKHARLVAPLMAGALLMTVGCATKKFVREEVGKSEAKLTQDVTRVETNLGQEQTRVTTVATEVKEVRGLATDASKRAEEAAGAAGQAATRAEQADGTAREATARADQAATKADQATARAEDATGKAAQAMTRSDEASGKATQALAKAEETDGRLTRLWTSRNKRNLVETVVIGFGFDRWELDDRAQTALLELAKQIQGKPDLVIDLEGYTDSMGPTPYNVQLSERRAEAVRRFLVEKGVELHRIQSIGLGPSRPAADNKTKQGRDQNRRVAVKVFSPGV